MAFRTVDVKPQTELLLDHFRHTLSITAVEAQALFRIRSLSRRINDLEAKGYLFSRVNRKDSRGQRYVRYYLLGKKLQTPQLPPMEQQAPREPVQMELPL